MSKLEQGRQCGHCLNVWYAVQASQPKPFGRIGWNPGAGSDPMRKQTLALRDQQEWDRWRLCPKCGSTSIRTIDAMGAQQAVRQQLSGVPVTVALPTASDAHVAQVARWAAEAAAAAERKAVAAAAAEAAEQAEQAERKAVKRAEHEKAKAKRHEAVAGAARFTAKTVRNLNWTNEQRPVDWSPPDPASRYGEDS